MRIPDSVSEEARKAIADLVHVGKINVSRSLILIVHNGEDLFIDFACFPHTRGNSQSKIKTKAGEEGGRALNKELEKKC